MRSARPLADVISDLVDVFRSRIHRNDAHSKSRNSAEAVSRVTAASGGSDMERLRLRAQEAAAHGRLRPLAPTTRETYARMTAEIERWLVGIGERELTVELWCRKLLESVEGRTATGTPWSPDYAELVAHAWRRHCRERGIADATDDERSRALLSIVRQEVEIEARPKKKARPLGVRELQRVVDAIGWDTIGVRDRALLLSWWCVPERGSIFMRLDREHVRESRDPDGWIATIVRSKTRAASGRQYAIPRLGGDYCPATALETWLEHSGITSGPVWRPTTPTGGIRPRRLTREALVRMLARRLRAVGLDGQGYSTHSIRRGVSTTAARAGLPAYAIRELTGHTSDAQVLEYVDEAAVFERPALAAIVAQLRRGTGR